MTGESSAHAQAARVLLIGGTSHAGKSTLRRVLAQRLGWPHRSTDQLARHPGRPWRSEPETVPAHVVAHFGALTVDALLQDVCAHYEAIWPALVAPMVAQAIESRSALVLEGSALLPAKVAGFGALVAAAWIVASEALLQRRVLIESGYGRLLPADRAPVDGFLARTIAFNAFVASEIARLRLPSVELHAEIPARTLQDRFLSAAGFVPLPPDRASRE